MYYSNLGIYGSFTIYLKGFTFINFEIEWTKNYCSEYRCGLWAYYLHPSLNLLWIILTGHFAILNVIENDYITQKNFKIILASIEIW